MADNNYTHLAGITFCKRAKLALNFIGVLGVVSWTSRYLIFQGLGLRDYLRCGYLLYSEDVPEIYNLAILKI